MQEDLENKILQLNNEITHLKSLMATYNTELSLAHDEIQELNYKISEKGIKEQIEENINLKNEKTQLHDVCLYQNQQIKYYKHVLFEIQQDILSNKYFALDSDGRLLLFEILNKVTDAIGE